MTAARTSAILLLTLAACSGSKAPAGSPADSARPEASPTASAPAPFPSAASRPTEADLLNYIGWQREMRARASKHRLEQEGYVQNYRLYHPGLAVQLEKDSGFMALLERQRDSMRELEKRMPTGPSVMPLGTVLNALGMMTASGDTLAYVPRRDEEALKAARARYGNDFVQWVLDHESTINATLAGPVP